MKKLFLVVAVAVCGLVSAQTGFKAGFHLGLPIGDAGDFYSFNVGLDASYLWKINDKFQAGGTTGYTLFNGKTVNFPIIGDIKYSNVGFIPVAGTAQYSLTDKFFVGGDLGYAIYAGEGNGKGGVYYFPKVGFQTETFEIYTGYKGISADGGSITVIPVGFNYKF